MKIDYSYMEVVAQLENKNMDEVPLQTLISAMEKSAVHTFGWPIAAVIYTEDSKPKPVAGGIEAIFKDIGHREFWSLKRTTEFYFIGELFENTRNGAYVFIDTRTNRVAESFMRLHGLYRLLNFQNDDRVSVLIRHGNLNGKILGAGNPARIFPIQRKCQVNEVTTAYQMTLGEMIETDSLKRNVHRAIRDLGEMFDAFHPDKGQFTDPIVDAYLRGKII